MGDSGSYNANRNCSDVYMINIIQFIKRGAFLISVWVIKSSWNSSVYEGCNRPYTVLGDSVSAGRLYD